MFLLALHIQEEHAINFTTELYIECDKSMCFSWLLPPVTPLSVSQTNEVAWVIVLVQVTPWFNNRRKSASVLVKDLDYFTVL